MKNLFAHLLLVTLLLYTGAVFAQSANQSATGTVKGTVTDTSGALIPQAAVTIANTSGFSRKLSSGAVGAFEASRLVPGHYSVTVSAKGFGTAVIDNVDVFGDKVAIANIKLDVAAEAEVQVTAENPGLTTSPDDNANSVTIKGKDLDALSDDPDDLQNELTALAGPSAGPSGAQIYIDGFTGGQLPPKSSIREIRINKNPFSAQYDKLGYGRIEILTKPGTDKLHASFMFNGNDSAFNSLNPLVTSEPSYYSTFLSGSASGSLSRSSSWFVSAFRRDNQANAVVAATIGDASNNPVAYNTAVANPQTRLDLSPRFDFQFGSSNTLSVRYQFDRVAATNNGVTGTSLQQQAYNTLNYENTVQVSDTQVISSRVVNDLRFQFAADRNRQTPANTTPTVTVQGDFTNGGNNTGLTSDSLNRYEFQDYITAAEGKHALNFGTRLRLTSETNTTRSGFNGNFIYSAAAATGTTALQQYNQGAGAPTEYDLTTGNPTAKINLFDAALFFQDDWTIKPNLTFSYGLRYEGQNRIADHNDWAPRLAVSWAPAARNGKKASTVFRAGYGWFYDRFSPTYVLDAIHQNGINETSYVVKNPSFTLGNAPSAASLAGLSASTPTLYAVSPNMHAQLSMEAAVGADHSFGKAVTLSATYVNSRGVHQYNSDNINAYLPGTYNTTTATGVRPNGINENIYQFQSGGVYNQNQLMLNYSVRAKKLSLFGFYQLGFAKSDTSGATYFGSSPTKLGADYGRASFDVRNRFLIGGNYMAPFGISLSPFLVANSGAPFNITIGTDLNGDNQYNDRPSYATAASTDTLATSYGTFDLDPAATAQRIAYNLGTAPAEFSMNLRVAKSIGIGPRVEGGAGGSNGGAPGGGGPPGGGRGPGGGGLGPGGLSGNNGPPRLDQFAPRKYALTFSVMSRNIFNHVSYAAPNAVLDSGAFGKFQSIAGGFFGSAASNRSIDLQASFSF